MTTTNRAFCWGTNHQGQLGVGDVELENQQSLTPAPVAGGLTWDVVLAGSSYTCGIATDEAGYCWGDGGALGDGTTERRSAPVPVVGP